VIGTGLPGVDPRRLEVLPVATRPLLSLGCRSVWGGEAGKRAFDVAAAGLALAAALPLMVLTGLAIAVADGPPVLFRQTRVGRYGSTFTMFKFRTMSQGAEDQVIELRERNERDGPLFKLSNDPRVTRLGRLLRETKIDELPQLVNVLRGEMSLVGPRPALPSESATFSRALQQRHGARPGITGLWQVEAGDEPSFARYERLDLFYVENQSFSLDIAILLATLPTVLWRVYDRVATARRRDGLGEPPVEPLPAAVEVAAAEPDVIVLEALQGSSNAAAPRRSR
ncbi:MAG TPA: sugar transferase, partial [Actinomycetota bacterium]|nr:sugar transferase [Actinomycetota bacterium]